MKKRILCLAMAALMMLGMPMTAKAEHFEGSKNWLVKFTGEKMESNFKSSDAANEVLSNLQPGDSMDLQIHIENDTDGKTDWYMTNEVVKTLEDSNNSAQGGAYTYILTYRNPKGKETVIYSSEAVGGENLAKESGGEGLHAATGTLEDHFFLDRLDAGDKASVNLYVGLDGETQGNAYQDTLAKLQMNFAVEKVYPARESVDRTKVVEREIVSVKTGDTAPILLFSAVTLISGLVLLALAVKQTSRSRKRRKR